MSLPLFSGSHPSSTPEVSSMNPQPLVPALHQVPAASLSVARQLAAAAAMGLVVLYGVAFAESPLLHNAAHDVRHVTVKPCH
jgi:cobalt transporter subunit CbtB